MAQNHSHISPRESQPAAVSYHMVPPRVHLSTNQKQIQDSNPDSSHTPASNCLGRMCVTELALLLISCVTLRSQSPTSSLASLEVICSKQILSPPKPQGPGVVLRAESNHCFTSVTGNCQHLKGCTCTQAEGMPPAEQAPTEQTSA